MTEERWGEIQDLVKEKFEIVEETTEPLEWKTGGGETAKIGQKQIMVFNGPLGKTRLEYITKPVILEKKEHYTKRMGTSSATEYVYSDTDFTRRLEVFVWRNGDWQKAETSLFE